VLDQKIIVVRNETGELKAFYNICSHRGHLLAKQSGNARRLACPFHAWIYDLDGNLQSAPNSKKVAGFDFSEHALVAVRVEQFLNLVMVNLDPAATPLAAMAGALAGEISQYLPDTSGFQLARTDSFNLACNWKFVFDQLECYHCPMIHPEAALAVDFERRETAEHDWYHSATSYLAPRTDHDELLIRARKGDAFQNNHVWYLWPNYMLLGQPGPTNFSLVEALPQGPEAVCVRVHHFFPTLPPAEESLRQMNGLRDIVFPQDFSAVESQQNGVKSRGYRGGRLMVDQARSYLSEHPTHWFDKKVWDIHNPG
jgi:carnitine monooxygenase subunit